MNNNKGFILISSYMIVVLLLILGNAMFLSTTAQLKRTDNDRRNLQTFYLSEAGVDYALAQLKNDPSTAGSNDTSLYTVSDVGIGGDYSVAWENTSGNEWKITSTGQIKNSNNTILRQRMIEMVVEYNPPVLATNGEFDDAIHVAGDISITGNSYTVNGDVTYGGSDGVEHEENITGSYTNDPSINPSANFDMDALKAISQAQGNYWDADRIESDTTLNFPSDFYYEGTTPAIVFIDVPDYPMNGTYFNNSGFWIINGNVTVNGSITIDGGVYTTGDFTLSGGGSEINIDGAIIAEGNVSIAGGRTITYNEERMDNLEALISGTGTFELVSWEEK